MRKLKAVVSVAAWLALTAGVGTAQAALHARAGGMVYDDVQNLTWLADMNYSKTSGYDSDGLMDWNSAKAWAENLTYGGYSDWRLPALNPSDLSCSYPFGEFRYGYNCIGGELSHLFVADLGNKRLETVLIQTGDTDVQKANLALFSNVQASRDEPRGIYWSSTEYANHPPFVWTFSSALGSQDLDDKHVARYAVAVHPGDVAAVPEPHSVAMLLAGLGVLAVAVRRRPLR